MDDMISRQVAIDVILADKIDNKSLEVMDVLGSGNEAKTLNMTCDRHAELLKSLPSVQPEVAKDTNVSINDCVNRQAMFEMVAEYEKQLREIYGDENELVETVKILKHRLLIELPSVLPETCEGCKHLGKWENEVEYGYPSPCTRCKRRVGDHYER